MRNAGLLRAFSPLVATGTMWAVDLATGRVQSLPQIQYEAIVGSKEASIYKFFTEEGRAYTESARVLAEIARRN